MKKNLSHLLSFTLICSITSINGSQIPLEEEEFFTMSKKAEFIVESINEITKRILGPIAKPLMPLMKKLRKKIEMDPIDEYVQVWYSSKQLFDMYGLMTYQFIIGKYLSATWLNKNYNQQTVQDFINLLKTSPEMSDEDMVTEFNTQLPLLDAKLTQAISAATVAWNNLLNYERIQGTLLITTEANNALFKNFTNKKKNKEIIYDAISKVNVHALGQ